MPSSMGIPGLLILLPGGGGCWLGGGWGRLGLLTPRGRLFTGKYLGSFRSGLGFRSHVKVLESLAG